VRSESEQQVAFYRRLGYEVTAEHSHEGYDRPTWVLMDKDVPAPAARSL